jgi:hypothetical protein
MTETQTATDHKAMNDSYAAIDVSVNCHLPECSYRLLPLGLYKAAGPTWVEKIRAGWTTEYMVEMMDRSNVQLSLLISLWCANGVGGEEIYIAAEEMFGMIGQFPRQVSGAGWHFADSRMERSVLRSPLHREDGEGARVQGRAHVSPLVRTPYQ